MARPSSPQTDIEIGTLPKQDEQGNPTLLKSSRGEDTGLVIPGSEEDKSLTKAEKFQLSHVSDLEEHRGSSELDHPINSVKLKHFENPLRAIMEQLNLDDDGILRILTSTHFDDGIVGGLEITGNVLFNDYLGLGVSSPIRRLDILTGTTSRGMVIRSATNATNVAGHLWPGTSGFVIDAKLGDLTGAANLQLRTGSADRLFISGSTGNIGIGTNSPSQLLEITGGSYPALRFSNNSSSRDLYIGGGSQSSLGTVECTIGVTNGNLHIDSHSSYAIYFQHYAQKNTYFGANGGYVGIGTTSVSYHLVVAGSIYAHSWLRTYAKTGWYSQSYGGGIYMVDTTYVRTYGNKKFHVNQQISGLTLHMYDQSPSNRSGYGDIGEPATGAYRFRCRNGAGTAFRTRYTGGW